jgi:tetratricopeptide (TPR) repeat protein
VTDAVAKAPRALEDVVHPTLLLVLLLTLVAACHAPALGGPFIWDDKLLIVDAPRVVEFRPLKEYFVNPFWSGGGVANSSEAYFRPLIVLSFALDYALFNGNPAGFHVTNLAFHLLNTALVYAWVRRRTQGPLAALAMTAVFGLHPRLTEAVSWISGRTDVFATTFVLLSLVTWSKDSLARRLASAALLLPGLLCKEVAFAGALALGVQEWLALGPAPLAARLRRVAPVAVVLLTYATLRLSLFRLRLRSLDLGVFGRAEAVLEALGRYVLALVDPWQARALNGAIGDPSLPLVAFGALVLLALIALAVALVRSPAVRRRFTENDAPALTLVIVGLGLAMHIAPIPAVTSIADRFLYLPMVGVVAFFAPRLERLGERFGAVRLAVLALLVSFGFVTARRAALWADEIAFWLDEHRHAPGALYVASVELGSALSRAGLFREAFELADGAVRGPKGERRIIPLYNSALALARLGRTDEARKRFADCARSEPADPRYRRASMLLDLQEMKFDSARRGVQALIQRGEAIPKDRNLLVDLPKFERAKAQLEDETFRNSPAGILLEAQLLLRIARFYDALPLWEKVLETQGKAQATEALRQLIAYGTLEQLNRSVARYQARFGSVSSDFANAYLVRRAELEAALRAKQELGI